MLGVAPDRTEASLTGLLTTCRAWIGVSAAVEAVCTDMHQPYLSAVVTVLTDAESVFGKFHVLQHASAALDEVRRQAFFRAGPVMREHGRGTRWLLLRRWKTVRGSKRQELQQLFAANRRLFKACVLREQLDRLWTDKTREGVARFLFGWLKALRWQRLPEMEKLGDTLVNHFDGIATYCDQPVRFGAVESLLLGTLAGVPACDRFFIDGFKESGRQYSYLKVRFVERLLQFCPDCRTELRSEQAHIEAAGGMRYPFMKLADMYFWQLGYEAAARKTGGAPELSG